MYTLMLLQAACTTECFFTYITAIWMLPSTYTLMYFQSILFPECFITHITRICTFHNMYPLLLCHSALLTKCSTEGSLLQRKKEAILPF